MGFHPLVAFDGATGDFLKAQLRPGNVYTSNGVVEFIRPLIKHYNEMFPGLPCFFVEIAGLLFRDYTICVKKNLFCILFG